ncbi:hypothetical protein ADK34_26120, partial [Streptomyces viridochromogenes]
MLVVPASALAVAGTPSGDDTGTPVPAPAPAPVPAPVPVPGSLSVVVESADDARDVTDSASAL